MELTYPADRQLCRSIPQSKSWRKSLSKTIKLGFMGDNPCTPKFLLSIFLTIFVYLVSFPFPFNFLWFSVVMLKKKKGRTSKAVLKTALAVRATGSIGP